jgi:hypothetical protein
MSDVRLQTLVHIHDFESSALLHALANYAWDIKVKNILTSQAGNFRFILPSKSGSDSIYRFNDISKHDWVEIYIKKGTINPATDTPKMTGNIETITSQGGKDGVLRTVSGLDMGARLLQRINSRKVWANVDADVIANAVCTDLGIDATNVDACTDHVSLTADAQTYADILKNLSDYWINAGTQVRRDYYVKAVSALTPGLVWKNRPFRTTGVKTLTYGRHFVVYTLSMAGEIKNRILVYGKKTEFNPKDPLAFGRKEPANGDDWTEDSTDWTRDVGTLLSTDGGDRVLQTSSIKITCANVGGVFDTQIHIDGLGPYWVEGLAGYSQLEWHAKSSGSPSTLHVRIYAPDDANYFEADFTDPGGAWTKYTYALGRSNEYNSVGNPDGKWSSVGSPDWEQISGIEFQTAGHNNVADYMKYDALCLSFGRWRNIAADADSQTAYDQCDLVVVDDDLWGDTACGVRGESILMQRKDPVRQLTVSVDGEDNLLLGDQLHITLPPENLSAVHFDVVVVEDTVDGSGWKTTFQALEQVGGISLHRNLVPVSPTQAMQRDISRLAAVARGVNYVGSHPARFA